MQRTAFTEELVTVTINNVLPLETAHAFTSGFFDFVLICFYRSLITTLSSHLTSNKISKKNLPPPSQSWVDEVDQITERHEAIIGGLQKRTAAKYDVFDYRQVA